MLFRSPYIFLLCVEGLLAHLQKANNSGSLKGIQSSRGGPWISHLFFADDSLLFGQASIMECRKILNILNVYEQCFGQKINKEKMALFFSPNTDPSTRKEIQEFWGSQDKQFQQIFGLTGHDWKIKKSQF